LSQNVYHTANIDATGEHLTHHIARDGDTDTMQFTATHKKALDHYYKELAAYHEKKVTHETAVRSAKTC